jgi:hypothetical protein
MKTIYAGIDPGKTGSVAFLSSDGTPIGAVAKMPWQGDRLLARELFHAMVAMVSQGELLKVTVEKVHSMPGDKNRLRSMWTFAQAYGGILAVVDMLECPVQFVAPQTWKKKMVVDINKTDKKAASLEVARNLFPSMSKALEKKSSHNLAEAALICEFGRRRFITGDA